MFKDIAVLIFTTKVPDDDGFDTESSTKIEVFVNKKSVTRAEFYTAMQSGIKPENVFEMRIEDWELSRHIDGEKVLYADKVEYDGGTYNIIRSYEKGESIIELTCTA